HLVHDDITPARARLDDLLAVADALYAGGVPMLLIRRDRSTPVLVVDIERREDAVRSLHEHLPADPFYIRTKGAPAVPLEDATTPGASPSALRIFRPRITSARTLRYDGRLAVRVEFWRF